MDKLKEKKGRHGSMEQFHYQRCEPLINELTLWQVADIAGQTPFYIYDFEVVVKRVAALRRALPSEYDCWQYRLRYLRYCPLEIWA